MYSSKSLYNPTILDNSGQHLDKSLYNASILDDNCRRLDHDIIQKSHLEQSSMKMGVIPRSEDSHNDHLKSYNSHYSSNSNNSLKMKIITSGSSGFPYIAENNMHRNSDINTNSENITTTNNTNTKSKIGLIPNSPYIGISLSMKKPYKCGTCRKGFAQRGHLINHELGGRKHFFCTFCNKAFSQEIILRNHVRTHTGERPFHCSYCTRTFCQVTEWRNHERTHTGERPFKCALCPKAFSQQGNMKIHMRTHSGIKPYKCDTCGKCFSQKNNLRNHIRTHTGEKPHRCAVCQKSFAQVTNLNNHERTHTLEELQRVFIQQPPAHTQPMNSHQNLSMTSSIPSSPSSSSSSSPVAAVSNAVTGGLSLPPSSSGISSSVPTSVRPQVLKIPTTWMMSMANSTPPSSLSLSSVSSAISPSLTNVSSYAHHPPHTHSHPYQTSTSAHLPPLPTIPMPPSWQNGYATCSPTMIPNPSSRWGSSVMMANQSAFPGMLLLDDVRTDIQDSPENLTQRWQVNS
ncbi:zinc finger protein 16-like [Octopus vulgaris]|uniref:Zinc finger protein 16-like n=1 Tax=Octopus vulgaris TaxID=6645 RepID=A0AA36BEK3_OCTVU|nr:zinc finger protein 16-like [Octopus vulgaris]